MAILSEVPAHAGFGWRNARWMVAAAVFVAGSTACTSEAGPGPDVGVDATASEVESTNRAGLVLVYDGPRRGTYGTTCSACADSAVKVARAAGYRVERIYANEITSARLDAARVFLWPGGGDDSTATFTEFRNAAAPGHDNVAELRDWVRGGGRYMGLCMGAFLVGSTPQGSVFDMLNGADAIGEAKDFASHAVRVRFTSSPEVAHSVYYQAGPYFTVMTGQEVWARYETTGRTAALVTSFGLGTVGAVGPHFEATSDWYDDCVPQRRAAASAEWATCASLSRETVSNNAFLMSFLRRVATR